jgi:hypothetical protein
MSTLIKRLHPRRFYCSPRRRSIDTDAAPSEALAATFQEPD